MSEDALIEQMAAHLRHTFLTRRFPGLLSAWEDADEAVRADYRREARALIARWVDANVGEEGQGLSSDPPGINRPTA